MITPLPPEEVERLRRLEIRRCRNAASKGCRKRHAELQPIWKRMIRDYVLTGRMPLERLNDEEERTFHIRLLLFVDAEYAHHLRDYLEACHLLSPNSVEIAFRGWEREVLS